MEATVLAAIVVVCAAGAACGFVFGFAFAFIVLRAALRGRHGDHVMRLVMYLRNTARPRRARTWPRHDEIMRCTLHPAGPDATCLACDSAVSWFRGHGVEV